MSIWITGGENKSINHGSLATDQVNVNLFEGWSFDGANDYVSFADDARLTFPDADWSIGGWIKPEDNTYAASYILSWAPAGAHHIAAWISHNGTSYVVYNVRDASSDQATVGNTSVSQLTLNAWHHVLMARSGNDFILYIDGREAHRVTAASVDAIDASMSFILGARDDFHAERFFKGDMCNWAKWDSALSKADRNALVGGIDARLIDVVNLKWACPMKRGDYSVVDDHFTVTNNGSTDGTTYTATLTNAIDCDGLSVYQGTFDADTYGLTLDGDVLLASNEVQFGSQTWDISGSYDDSDITLLTAETSTVKLTGSGKTIARSDVSNLLENIWITGTYTLTEGHLRFDQDATIDGTLTLGSLWLTGYYDADLDINGTIDGTGTIQMYGMHAGHGWVGNDGSLALAKAYIDDPEATSIFDPGDYSGITGILYIRDRTPWAGDSMLKFAAGTFTFGDLQGYTEGTDDLYIDCTNNPALILTGDYTEVNISTGEVIWLMGDSDTITLSGITDQDIGFGSCIGDLIVNKSGGTVTLVDDLCCASLDIQDGNFDANGYNVTTGDFTVSNAGDTVSMGSGTWECSGNVDMTAGGTISGDTSTLKLTGTSKTLKGKTYPDLVYRVWITGSYTIPVDNIFGAFNGGLEVDGTLTISGHYFYQLDGNLDLNAGGLITGGKYLTISGGGITTLDGVWDTSKGYISNMLSSTPFVAGTIDVNDLYVRTTGSTDAEIRYGAGTHTFTGNVIYLCTSTGDLTVDTTTNSPTIEYQGDVTVQEDSTGQVIFA